jgi:hypothetical protein
MQLVIDRPGMRLLNMANWNPIIRQISLLATGLFVGVFIFLAEQVPPLYHEVREHPSDPIPMLAYYYIWFDESSWNRAKKDYPLLGRYSSDDSSVMNRHIDWAMDAGIDGFIVSWKGTDKLNRRLEQLVRLAEQKDFKLAIIYEGLDFYRDPLPVEKIGTDLDYFIEKYADSPAFELYEAPMVIWSGTWEFSRAEVQSITGERRDQILILASEKNLDGYRRLSDLVDGDAYYWSSVNPETHPGYEKKLKSMGSFIHANGGLWIAPAAPGFDARMVGGETVVEREDGKTLRIEIDTALRSSPEAIGLISWNEFSENSHIEPSQNYDHFYLKVLAELRRTAPVHVANFDSNVPGHTMSQLGFENILALGSFFVLIATSLFMIVRRSH